MTTTRFDVVVLGGGVAGAAAAIAAAQSGARTCVIAGAPGATALFSGAWRGACPEPLLRALAAVSCELTACAGPLPHPDGRLESCSYAPAVHAAAALTAGTLVAGIAGLPSFHAVALARLWSARTEFDVTATTLELDGTPAAGWAPVSLAAHLQRRPAYLAEPLQRAVREHGAARVVLPAVLGLASDGALAASVADAAGVPVGEALAIPPSLPGWRLHHALRRALEAATVTIVEGRAAAHGRSSGRIDSVRIENGDVVGAGAFVLATGKYVAGGIDAAGPLREPALDCPVWIDHLDERFESADALILTDPVRTEDQPLLRAGVHANAGQQPVTPGGDVVYENVYVAGSVRADWSAMTHSIGDAASDGWQAGLRAAP